MIGSRASFSCDPGFVFRPDDFIFRECMAGGVWSNAQPACIQSKQVGGANRGHTHLVYFEPEHDTILSAYCHTN